MNASTISIIIPAYQSADTIVATIRSLLQQTLKPSEIIVVDDASTDSLAEALKEFGSDVQLIRFEERSGAPKARNIGFQASKGDLVMFSDADLIFRPEALEKLNEALIEHPEAAYSYPSFKFGWIKFHGRQFSVDKLKQRNFIHTSALIRKTAQPKFDESLKRFQDWDLWLTLAEQGKFGVWVPEILFRALPRGKGLGISNWLPRFMYRVPWNLFGWKPERIRKYEEAARIIREKHKL